MKTMDVRNNYKSITEEFLKYYYETYDKYIPDLANLYSADSKFTWMNNEVMGFNNLLKMFVELNLTSVTHQIKEYSGQPMGPKTLMVNAVGLLNDDNSGNYVKFSESIILQYNEDLESFVIHNTILNILND